MPFLYKYISISQDKMFTLLEAQRIDRLADISPNDGDLSSYKNQILSYDFKSMSVDEIQNFEWPSKPEV